MRRFKPWPLQWATGLFIFAGTLCAWGADLALLEHEPLVVRYCEASRLGSLEAQYRLGML